VGRVSDDRMPMARLLAMAYRQLIEGLHERLAQRGWSDLRPPYGFVLVAARDRLLTAGDVTELLGMTKQATSQLLDAMEAEGLVERRPDPDDARVKRVAITEKGRRLLTTVEAIYAELEDEWAHQIGAERVEAMRIDLGRVMLGLYDGRLPPIRPVW
jgi:DNA-binding MarR family transcriptional regulator